MHRIYIKVTCSHSQSVSCAKLNGKNGLNWIHLCIYFAINFYHKLTHDPFRNEHWQQKKIIKNKNEWHGKWNGNTVFNYCCGTRCTHILFESVTRKIKLKLCHLNNIISSWIVNSIYSFFVGKSLFSFFQFYSFPFHPFWLLALIPNSKFSKTTIFHCTLYICMYTYSWIATLIFHIITDIPIIRWNMNVLINIFNVLNLFMRVICIIFLSFLFYVFVVFSLSFFFIIFFVLFVWAACLMLYVYAYINEYQEWKW